MRQVFYESGPMRTVPDHNYPAFMAVEKALAVELETTGSVDWEILNPARNFNGDKTRDTGEYMNLDLKMVLDADVIVLLPGWETSEGARREVELATWAHKSFIKAEPCNYRTGDEWHDWEFETIDVPSLDESPRASALAEATQLITGDRNSQYGPPTQDFVRTAAMCSAFGFQVDGKPMQAHHVAVFMMMLKISRLSWTPAKRDSWVDAAGYAGCGYECAVEEAANA